MSYVYVVLRYGHMMLATQEERLAEALAESTEGTVERVPLVYNPAQNATTQNNIVYRDDLRREA